MLTRNRHSKKKPLAPRPSAPATWKLQDAKARFSEVVRRAQAEGPQRVTVHGKAAVVIVSAEKYAKSQAPAQDKRTGAELIKAMQQARKLGLKLKPARFYLSARPPIDFSDGER